MFFLIRKVFMAAGLLLTGCAVAAPAAEPVDFARDIQPILARHCLSCHGPEKQRSGLRLDQRTAAFQGGNDHGPTIIPRDSAQSPLVQFVAGLVPDMEMPPRKNGTEPLSPDEINLLRLWIDQGAVWPDGVEVRPLAKADASWWSLQPLAEVSPPFKIIPKPWAQHPIDRFIFSALAGKGLTPSPPADRVTLIRRATYDLTGLPPTPEAVAAFLADESPEAYERLIDGLLASPHYGERWGRHWLDVVRFGESNGFERNVIIDNLWPFRDYVIRSFNEDKPFNQFIVEHLAGDVIGKDNPEVEIGAAFLVAGPYDNVGNQDPVQKQIIRANTLDEVITTASGAFLGLTLNCARCHDHKFDPVLQADYYRWYAVFDGVNHGERTLSTPEQRRLRDEAMKPLEARRAELTKERNALAAAILKRAEANPEIAQRQFALPVVDPYLTEDRFTPVEARHVRLTIISSYRNPKSPGGARVDEFEVWTANADPINVALKSNGATAEGDSSVAEDFPGAYAATQAIDGQLGTRWIAQGRAQLTVTLAKPARIERVAFSSDRGRTLPRNHGYTTFVGEYRLEVSLDGHNWIEVANSLGRPPINDAFRRERFLQAAIQEDERQQLARMDRSLAEVDREMRAVPALPVVWAGNFRQPKESVHLMLGGDPTRKGEVIAPGSVSVLETVAGKFELPADSAESERRRALAEWIASDANPLTARVLANRVWQHHFGTGIVNTPSDFGWLGGRPTHPELLDWLARRLHAHGWRLKPLHREIMLSQTYRQASEHRDADAQVDAESRYLWRFPPRRLTAEEIRDTMLGVAGKLDRRMGGAGFRLYRYLQDNVATYVPLDQHGSETYRRAVYHQNARAAAVDLLSDFDAPDCAFAAPARSSTITPLQALTVMNHTFTLDMARGFAERLEREAGKNEVESQVRRAWSLAYGREPLSLELNHGAEMIRRHGLVPFCRAILNSNELISVR